MRVVWPRRPGEPANSVLPGETIEVHADVDSPSGRALEYRWRFASQDFDFKVARIASGEHSASARIVVPRKEGVYRIYLAASDGHALDEATLAVQVSREPSGANGTRATWASLPMRRRAAEP